MTQEQAAEVILLLKQILDQIEGVNRVAAEFEGCMGGRCVRTQEG